MKIALSILGVIIIIIGLVFFFRETPSPQDVGDAIIEEPVVEQESFDITRTFEDGVHTISGVVTLPTPCHLLQENVRVAESLPEQIFITLTTQATDGICIQVLDAREFSIDVEASEEAAVSLSINGVDVPVPNLET